MFERKDCTYLSRASFRHSTLLALCEKIRLGWKGLARTNTLAYYEHLPITDAKSFKTLGLGPTVISLLCP
jgi:hypothetical protein